MAHLTTLQTLNEARPLLGVPERLSEGHEALTDADRRDLLRSQLRDKYVVAARRRLECEIQVMEARRSVGRATPNREFYRRRYRSSLRAIEKRIGRETGVAVEQAEAFRNHDSEEPEPEGVERPLARRAGAPSAPASNWRASRRRRCRQARAEPSWGKPSPRPALRRRREGRASEPTGAGT